MAGTSTYISMREFPSSGTDASPPPAWLQERVSENGGIVRVADAAGRVG
jgi:hypothetical protein